MTDKKTAAILIFSISIFAATCIHLAGSQTPIYVRMMPASMTATILTRRYGGSPDFAARAAVVTTLLSLVTIPVALILLKNIIAGG